MSMSLVYKQFPPPHSVSTLIPLVYRGIRFLCDKTNERSKLTTSCNCLWKCLRFLHAYLVFYSCSDLLRRPRKLGTPGVARPHSALERLAAAILVSLH